MSPRGPRGWVRSDERILDELCERIVRAGVDASELEVAVADREVRLRGVLATARDRRLAMDLAERVLGVRAVDAEILVGERWDEVEDEPTWHCGAQEARPSTPEPGGGAGQPCASPGCIAAMRRVISRGLTFSFAVAMPQR